MSPIAPLPSTPVAIAAEPTVPTPAAGASSRPAIVLPAGAATSDTAAEPPPAPETPQALQRELDRVLEQAQAQTSLRFRVDEDAHRIVVSVVDRLSGEVLLQIPDENALAIARRLAETGRGLLDQRA